MRIPVSITVNTGEQYGVYPIIEKFFSEARAEIEKKIKIEEGPSDFRIEIKSLCKLVAGTSLESNEFAQMLYYKDKVVAVVLETRTEMNYIHFDYFLNLKHL